MREVTASGVYLLDLEEYFSSAKTGLYLHPWRERQFEVKNGFSDIHHILDSIESTVAPLNVDSLSPDIDSEVELVTR